MSDGASEPKAGNTSKRTETDTAAPLTISFDQAQSELEGLIDRIESGEIGLEDAVKSYEHGVRLVKHCRQILTQTEQRFADLSAEMRDQK